MKRECKNLAKRKASETRSLFTAVIPVKVREKPRRNPARSSPNAISTLKRNNVNEIGHVSVVPPCWAM